MAVSCWGMGGGSQALDPGPQQGRTHRSLCLDTLTAPCPGFKSPKVGLPVPLSAGKALSLSGLPPSLGDRFWGAHLGAWGQHTLVHKPCHPPCIQRS